MGGWGVTLMVLGFGSLLLRMTDMQFILMSFLDPYQPFAGIVVGLGGLIMTVMGYMGKKD